MSDRTYNTIIREPWNSKIHNILKTIDLHTKLHLETGDNFHLIQADILRTYVLELKKWILSKEKDFS
jgi:hypothetical protein